MFFGFSDMWVDEKPRVPIFARLYSHIVDVTFLCFTYRYILK